MLLLLNFILCINLLMERKPFTTSLNTDLLKAIKKLAIDLDKNVNDVIEEAFEILLKKYEKILKK
jgi:hypothetical protein